MLNHKRQSFIKNDLKNYMLSLARELDSTNLIFQIHTDETISAEILQEEIRDELLNEVKLDFSIMMP